MFEDSIAFIKSEYQGKDSIPLHEPFLSGNAKNYVNECIESSHVSSVGSFVNRFENMVAKYTNATYAIATINGTAALHLALILAGVNKGDEVITQPLTYVATVNAISYIGAQPIFIDVEKTTLGLSPEKLEHFLKTQTTVKNGCCFNKTTGKQIKAVVPMHTLGFPSRINDILDVCQSYQLKVIEDAAESLGSFYKDQHTGTFGLLGVLSFNGNKTITTGGGGIILTNDKAIALKAKHLSTNAKKEDSWGYVHDSIGYNYRMPALNAALGCAQMEELNNILLQKRRLAQRYAQFFKSKSIDFIKEPKDSHSNYWLNAICLENIEQRDLFLSETNSENIKTRPLWQLMNHLDIYTTAQQGNLENAIWLQERIVNLPSSVVNVKNEAAE
ncbi:LegC family aminotransferase [Sediminibacter sp. Hel_I_10]|uniref:LegC family aminotransferase n=1 Tax=Sediminibacter sp. Hel_I_10 TaxID=1392490 RepID=UPI00047BE53D|nr:LegC family aminotransferase [Sediminibacter sp. Hel_I_10]